MPGGRGAIQGAIGEVGGEGSGRLVIARHFLLSSPAILHLTSLPTILSHPLCQPYHTRNIKSHSCHIHNLNIPLITLSHPQSYMVIIFIILLHTLYNTNSLASSQSITTTALKTNRYIHTDIRVHVTTTFTHTHMGAATVSVVSVLLHES